MQKMRSTNRGKVFERQREWVKYEYERMMDMVCSCCYKKGKRVKFIDPIGYVCFSCFTTGIRCRINGCEMPACKHANGRCREHFVGDYEVDYDRLCGMLVSGIAACEDWA